MCGESWHAIKDSLTHRPSSQGWAPGVLPLCVCMCMCVCVCVCVCLVVCLVFIFGWRVCVWWVGGGEGGGVALGSFSSSFLASMLYIRFSWCIVWRAFIYTWAFQ